MNGRLYAMIWLAVIGGGIAFAVNTWLLEFWSVPADDPLLHASIAPTLRGGDSLVISRQTGIERGQLVRCTDPEAAGRFVIGRAMARGAETVDIDHEYVVVDRRRTPTPRACDPQKIFDPKRNEELELQCAVEEYAGREFQILRSAPFPEPPVHATVEHMRWYLVSDNRHTHLDSRDFGTIDPTTCQRILLRLVGPAGIGDSDTRFTVLW